MILFNNYLIKNKLIIKDRMLIVDNINVLIEFFKTSS